MSTRIIGASVWEQELFDHFRFHIEHEDELIAAYGELAASTTVPGFGYLAKLILADEQRHHQLFADLAETIEAEAESLADGSAVPSISVRRLSEDERQRILALTDRFLALERDDARDLEHLAKKLKVVKDTTLWHLLVELMRDDTQKHIRMLRFIRDHVRNGAV
jgi:rubrerythrin